jgi:hypothetical protein
MTKKLVGKTRLFSSEISIYEEDILMKGLVGHSNFVNNELLVHPVDNKDLYFETVMHEIVHLVLYKIGRSDLTEDEGFVEVFSNAISQAISEYKEIEETTDEDE